MNTLKTQETTLEIATLVELLRTRLQQEYGGNYSFGIFANGKIVAAHSKDYGDVIATPYVQPKPSE